MLFIIYLTAFFKFGQSVVNDKPPLQQFEEGPSETHLADEGTEKDFLRAGHVEELYIYPIKSCKGNKVDWIDCGERGSVHGDQRDRHFLVVDSAHQNLMMTGRIYPKLVLIEANLENNVLRVQFPDGKAVEVDLTGVVQRNEIRRARLFDDMQSDGFDCGDEMAKTLDDFLLEGADKSTRQLRLIYFGNEQLYTERNPQPDERWWSNNKLPKVDDKIAYADLAGYMAFSSASVDDINSHLSQKVDARYFRPNLVIGGLPPFDEDKWLYVRAGEAEFACYKPCTRCVMTTIDPDTGRKDDNMEPLRELRKYRLAPGKLYDVFKQKPIFGVNMAIIKPGRVRVGDPVWVQYKAEPF